MRLTGIGAVLALVLAGCGNGGSAVETRARTDAPVQAVAGDVSRNQPDDVVPARAEEVKPPAPERAARVLTSNRRENASAKAVRLFERNGADFGATSPDDYLAKAQAFTAHPPAGTEKISRPNGDILLYQARTNTFAVVDRRGVVRTMFKPSGGTAYWEDQKAAAPSFGR